MVASSRQASSYAALYFRVPHATFVFPILTFSNFPSNFLLPPTDKFYLIPTFLISPLHSPFTAPTHEGTWCKTPKVSIYEASNNNNYK